MRLMFKLLIGVFAAVFLSSLLLGYVSNLENPSPVTSLNPNSGGPRVLVVGDPGVSDFEPRVAEAVSSGLIDAGWRVDVTTASGQTPTDLSGYSLVVLCCPIYGGMPSKPMQDYLSRLGSLEGVRVATVMTGAGSSDEAKAWMTGRIGGLGGDEVLSLVVTSMAPNEQQYGSTDPVMIAERAMASLPV